MRFERVVIEGYGRLRGLDSGDAPLGGLVVVQGDNEAGKSTLFHCLTTLLFGFDPAHRDRHPYLPWDGGPLECAAEVRLDDGTPLHLQRRLLSRPHGSLERGSLHEDLANRAVPWAEAIGRDLYQSVFALTLEQLSELNAPTWIRIQERLLTGLGAPDLGSVAKAVAALENEAVQAWRPDRRGKPQTAAVATEILKLEQRMTAARAHEDGLRAASERRARCTAELAQHQQALEDYAVRQARVEARLGRHRALELAQEQAGPPESPDDPPEDAAVQLTALDHAAEEHTIQCERLAARRRALLAAEAALSQRDRDWLLARDALHAFEAEMVRADALAVTEREARSRCAQLETRHSTLWNALGSSLRNETGTAPGVPRATQRASPIGAARRSGLSAADLATLVAERERLDALDIFDGAGEERPLPAEPPFPWLALSLVLVGISITVLAMVLDAARQWGAVGLGIALVGGAMLMRSLHARAQGLRAAAEARHAAAQRTRERALRASERAALATRLVEALGRTGLVPSAATLELPAELPERWQAVIEVEDQHTVARDAAERARRDLATLADRRATLEDRCGPLPTSPTDLRGALDAVLARAARAEHARDERTEREEELQRCSAARAAVSARRADLAARLAAIGGGSVERGITVQSARWAARRRAADLARELADGADPGVPAPAGTFSTRDPPDLPASAPELARVLAAVAADRNACSARCAALQQELGGLEREREQRAREESVAEVASALAAARAERAALTRLRDRALLLARLLQNAERRFRDAHQPDIVKRASRYLTAITGGQHDGLLVQDGARGIEFLLREGARGRVVKVDQPLSRGLRDQIFMALRLAIADHLDADGERLPILVDESLVNWDPRRRQQGIALLHEIATSRQVFFFSFEPQAYGLKPSLVLGARVSA